MAKGTSENVTFPLDITFPGFYSYSLQLTSVKRTKRHWRLDYFSQLTIVSLCCACSYSFAMLWDTKKRREKKRKKEKKAITSRRVSAVVHWKLITISKKISLKPCPGGWTTDWEKSNRHGFVRTCFVRFHRKVASDLALAPAPAPAPAPFFHPLSFDTPPDRYYA